MTPQEILPGTRLELELINRIGEKIGNTYVSQLLEKQEDDSLVISAPIYEARLIFIPLQAQIRLNFMHPKLGLLGFTAIVTGREYRENIAILIIQAAGELEKIQRRSHFRLDHIARALVWINGKNEKSDKKTAIKASTKNISGSGLCIVTEIEIPKNAEVDIEFDLTEDIVIAAKCIVVRKSSFEVKSSRNYETGLHFTNLSQKDQDSIIRFIFEQQRVQLKRETQ